MADWRDLDNELDYWRDATRTATFWWRDDDAVEPSEPLARLLAIASRYKAAVSLAVIPDQCAAELFDVINENPNISILQHGFSHVNHAPPNEKKAELGDHREQQAILRELAHGLKTIRRFNGGLAVLVPPWNRIDSALLARLPALGYKGISTYSRRKSIFATPGLININGHVDIIDWHGGRGFIGDDVALDLLIGHLVARREGDADIAETTGLLTHHLVHDEGCWRFVEQFHDCLGRHKAARLIDISEALTI